MADDNKQVALTIMEQLGGRRFKAMTGAKNFTCDVNWLAFKLPARFAAKGINYIKITLNGKDLYDVDFRKLWGMKITDVSAFKDVYAEDLQALFVGETQLNLTL